MTEGGEGFSPDEEIRNKISEAHTGKKLSEEHRRAIGEGLRGRKNSEETKKRMSESAKKSWTNERREAISEKLKGKPKSEEHRKRLSESHTENVTMVAEGEEVVLVFSNRKEAYKYCVEQGLANCTYQTFTVSIRNSIKRNQKRYGFKWRIEK